MIFKFYKRTKETEEAIRLLRARLEDLLDRHYEIDKNICMNRDHRKFKDRLDSADKALDFAKTELGKIRFFNTFFDTQSFLIARSRFFDFEDEADHLIAALENEYFIVALAELRNEYEKMLTSLDQWEEYSFPISIFTIKKEIEILEAQIGQKDFEELMFGLRDIYDLMLDTFESIKNDMAQRKEVLADIVPDVLKKIDSLFGRIGNISVGSFVDITAVNNDLKNLQRSVKEIRKILEKKDVAMYRMAIHKVYIAKNQIRDLISIVDGLKVKKAEAKKIFHYYEDTLAEQKQCLEIIQEKVKSFSEKDEEILSGLQVSCTFMSDMLITMAPRLVNQGFMNAELYSVGINLISLFKEYLPSEMPEYLQELVNTDAYYMHADGPEMPFNLSQMPVNI